MTKEKFHLEVLGDIEGYNKQEKIEPVKTSTPEDTQYVEGYVVDDRIAAKYHLQAGGITPFTGLRIGSIVPANDEKRQAATTELRDRSGFLAESERRAFQLALEEERQKLRHNLEMRMQTLRQYFDEELDLLEQRTSDLKKQLQVMDEKMKTPHKDSKEGAEETVSLTNEIEQVQGELQMLEESTAAVKSSQAHAIQLMSEIAELEARRDKMFVSIRQIPGDLLKNTEAISELRTLEGQIAEYTADIEAEADSLRSIISPTV